MNQPIEGNTEIPYEWRILIRENNEDFTDTIKDYVIASGKENGIRLDESSFVVDNDEDFDPRIVLGYDSVLLHDVSPGDLDNLIELLKVHPHLIPGITILVSVAENEEQIRCIGTLTTMGVKTIEKDATISMRAIASNLLLLES